MNLSPELHATLAAQLHDAQRTRTQLEQFSRLHPTLDIEDSYAIQSAWMKLCLAQGRKVIGHKIGLTSRAMQISSQITEPDYGTLLDDMLIPDGSEIRSERFILPRLEVEFAFILAKPLQGPGVTIFDVLNCVFRPKSARRSDPNPPRIPIGSRHALQFKAATDSDRGRQTVLGRSEN